VEPLPVDRRETVDETGSWHDGFAMENLFRWVAFSQETSGGNPAGVWIGESLPEPAEMQRIAAEVGYSETAFLVPVSPGRWTVRYYSPQAEVPFCGHATVASGVALGDRLGEGDYQLSTRVGDVPVRVEASGGHLRAALTSVAPEHRSVRAEDLEEALRLLGWGRGDLDPTIPPALAYAGAWHLVLALSDRATLSRLDYDFDGLKRFMLDRELTTLQLVWRENATTFHSRNPFPVGGIVEDPATGAAAAALGGYLRDASLIDSPAEVLILQGEDMGRPSSIYVTIPAVGGIEVAGTAVTLDDLSEGPSTA